MKTEHDISKLEEPAIFGSETMREPDKYHNFQNHRYSN